MFELLEVLVVLLFVIGTTAFFSSALYEVVANWFNIRGVFFRRNLEEYIQKLNDLVEPPFTTHDFDEVSNRIAIGSSHEPTKKRTWLSRFFRPQNRFPEEISSDAMAEYLGIRHWELEKFTVHYKQFEEQLTVDYKAQVKRYLFIPGLLLVMAFRVDLVEITKYMFENDDARIAAVASIKEKVQNYEFPADTASSETNEDSLKQAVMDLLTNYNLAFESNKIPIGWESPAYTNWSTDIAAMDVLMALKKKELCTITGDAQWSTKGILEASGKAGAANTTKAYKAAQELATAMLAYQLKWGETQTSCSELNSNYINLKYSTAPAKTKGFSLLLVLNWFFLALCSMMGGPYWFELIGKIVGK